MIGPDWVAAAGAPTKPPAIRGRFAVPGGFQVPTPGNNALSNGSQTAASFQTTYTLITDTIGIRCLFVNGTYKGGNSGQLYGLKDNGGSATSAGDLTLTASVDTANSFSLGFWGPSANGAFTIAPGGWAWTNSVGQLRAAGAALAVKAFAQVASGKKWYYTRQQNIDLDSGTDAVMHQTSPTASGTDITDREWTYGPPIANGANGSSASYSQLCPTAVVGVQATPKVIVGVRGDSILFGAGPADAQNWVQKALAAGPAIYAYNAAISGSTAYNIDLYDALGPTLAQFADYWVIQWQNDAFTGSLSDFKAGILAQARAYSQGGARRVIVATALPRTTSTDSWATATNQSTVSGEAVRTAFNDWLRDSSANGARAQSGGMIWMVVDASAGIEVNASNALTQNGGRWIATGSANYATADGTHPTNASRNLISTCLPIGMLELY